MATSYYSTGSITLTNGSAVVAGSGTLWQTSLITNGVVFVEGEGNPLPILTVDSDSQITSEINWTGPTGTYSYAILRQTEQMQDNAENSRALAYIISEIRNGTMFKYDASGSLADRALYDGRPKGFGFLVLSGTTANLYVKASATSGDWAGPFAYGAGPVGPAPTLGIGTVTTRPAGQPATATISGSGGNYSLSLGLPAGELTPEDEAQLNAAVDAASLSAAEAAAYAEIVGAAAYDFNFDTDPSSSDDWNN